MKRKDFYQLINSLKLNGNAVEIGVCEGGFSEQWLPKCNFEKVFLIDPWKHYESGYNDRENKEQAIQDQRFEDVTEKFKGFGKSVIIIREESATAIERFDDNYFDFIYIDANHSYENAKEDIGLWYPKCKKGGLFAGHDYTSKKHTGIKKAVNEFAEKNNMILNVCQERAASWWFVK